MKFFEAVPDELFSPLASPNRALYADALDVLCMAYRQKLRLPEDELYSMLRSRLEQQLADATFEGEDIDENELRDISGRARFLIRKLCAKGWFEKERGPDFREYITVPGYASRLLELFHELRDDRPARGFSYVFGTYSALRVADETGSAYEKMAAVYTAFDNTQALIRLLRLVYHNVKHYFQMQLELHDVGEVLSSYFDDFGQKVIEAYIRPLKIKDSVPKYRVPIRTVLMRWAEDDEQLAAMARATQKIENLTSREQNVRGDLDAVLTALSHSRRADGLTDRLRPVFQLYEQSYLSEKSLWYRKRPGKRSRAAAVLIEENETDAASAAQAAALLHSEYGRAAVAACVQGWLGDRDTCLSADIPLENDRDYVMSLLAVLSGGSRRAAYQVEELGGSVCENGYSIPKVQFSRKENEK